MHADDNICEDVSGSTLNAGEFTRQIHPPILLLIPDPQMIRKGRFFAAGYWKNSRTPIKDNIAEHRAAHNISDVWLWRAACER